MTNKQFCGILKLCCYLSLVFGVILLLLLLRHENLVIEICFDKIYFGNEYEEKYN